MKDNGYVYVLMNPAITNIVKIGKTTRDPEIRAEELSSATGVPSPFIVIYYEYFPSCSEAEIFVHTLLENKGYRVSKNREFFEISYKEAIDAVVMAKRHYSENVNDIQSCLNKENVTKSAIKQKEFWKDFYEIAEKYYFGKDDELQDYKQALLNYKKARKLGSKEADLKIGIMYTKGEGTKINENKALEFFKKGAQNGINDCFAEMAIIYNKRMEIDNSNKCWKKYLKLSDKIDYGYGIKYIESALIFRREVHYAHKLKVGSSNVKRKLEDEIKQCQIKLKSSMPFHAPLLERQIESLQKELDYLNSNFINI
jgi:hypothetical protein